MQGGDDYRRSGLHPAFGTAGGIAFMVMVVYIVAMVWR